MYCLHPFSVSSHYCQRRQIGQEHLQKSEGFRKFLKINTSTETSTDHILVYQSMRFIV